MSMLTTRLEVTFKEVLGLDLGGKLEILQKNVLARCLKRNDIFVFGGNTYYVLSVELSKEKDVHLTLQNVPHTDDNLARFFETGEEFFLGTNQPFQHTFKSTTYLDSIFRATQKRKRGIISTKRRL